MPENAYLRAHDAGMYRIGATYAEQSAHGTSHSVGKTKVLLWGIKVPTTFYDSRGFSDFITNEVQKGHLTTHTIPAFF